MCNVKNQCKPGYTARTIHFHSLSQTVFCFLHISAMNSQFKEVIFNLCCMFYTSFLLHYILIKITSAFLLNYIFTKGVKKLR